MAHVLIGFAEALPAPEVVFSLLKAGHRVSVFSRQKRLPLAQLPLAGFHQIPAPEADVAAASAALRALMAAPGAPDLLLPLDDAGLWLSAEAGIPAARIAGASGAQARVALDKSLQVAAAEAAGLALPPTLVLRSPAEALAADLPPSGIVKPALAIEAEANHIRKGAVLYLTPGIDRAQVAAHVAAHGPQLVQPLVAGVGQGVFGFATPEGVFGWSGHERVRMMNPHGSGSSACRRLQPGADLRAAVSRFLAEIGWRGPFMVELLQDAEGRQWFMELNGRMWGSLALARRQGLEYPAWAVEAALDPGRIPAAARASAAVDPADPGVMRELGRDLLHLAFVLRGPKSDFHRAGWPAITRSAAGVLRPASGRQFYNHDPAHPGFFLRHALHTVWRGLKR